MTDAGRTEWPDASVPDWLREAAVIERGRRRVNGTADLDEGPFVRWEHGEQMAMLDGNFTAGELRQIATMMEAACG